MPLQLLLRLLLLLLLVRAAAAAAVSPLAFNPSYRPFRSLCLPAAAAAATAGSRTVPVLPTAAPQRLQSLHFRAAAAAAAAAAAGRCTCGASLQFVPQRSNLRMQDIDWGASCFLLHCAAVVVVAAAATAAATAATAVAAVVAAAAVAAAVPVAASGVAPAARS